MPADLGLRHTFGDHHRRASAVTGPPESSFDTLVCHAIGPGAQNKIGPVLNGLDGRKAGTVPNFDYSDANKNSGIVWNEETFEDYIKNPAAKIPETKMTFAGVKNEQQAKDL